jgi:hypothetical protein
MENRKRVFQLSSARAQRFGWLAMVAGCMAVGFPLGITNAQAPAAGASGEATDAQGYKFLVPLAAFTDPANKIKLNQLKLEIRRIITGSAISDAASRASVDRYFQQYFFPLMTTEEGLKTIGTDRQNFLRDLAAAKDPAGHAYINNLTLAALSKIVADNFRLPSRYNAMLIISSLNDVEPALPNTLPEPMRTALPVILQQFQKADNPDPVKIAALLGLSRHLEFDGYRQNKMPAATRTEIVKELTGLAQAAEVPEGRDNEVHSWMRRRAIEGLGAACIARPDAEIAASLQAIVADDASPLIVRSTAATAVGKMSLQAPVKVDPVPAAKELGYLALLVCDTELTKAENFNKTDYEREGRMTGTYSGELEGSAGGGMPGGGRMMTPGMGSSDGLGGMARPLRAAPGTMPGGEIGGSADGYGSDAGGIDPSTLDPKHYRMDYLRRRMRQELYSVQLGLTGGEDFVEQKKGPKSAIAEKAGASTSRDSGDKKGVLSVAKGNDREAVLEVYYKVRKLVEIVESAAPEAELPVFAKDLRKEMKNLEAITKKLPLPGEVAAVEGLDEPTVPVARTKTDTKGKTDAKGKAVTGKGKGKGTVKGAPPAGKRPAAPVPAPGKRPAVPGKSAGTARPPVFGKPGR